MPEPVQTYKNHAKFVPLYHYVLFPLVTLNLFWAVRTAMSSPGADTMIGAATAGGLVLLTLFARSFALRVQDRVIRLEMRMRLKELLPVALHPRITEFTPGQLVALRFASDAELSDLAQTVLRDKISDKKTIKQMVKNWTADDLRA